ncbi:MAG: Peptidase, M23/M37 family [Candidatus Giovannonibacteria bacterium GW2011_GWA2_53_7]|uniref:Peptidase, M23/M37 family n=1 Tax=Candidatus Giovannonibacteria bacterium GW2011_GWA2_53_7 TaxID=1618650 RepID=A0A0G1XYV3_9BACT|nr:MAG: Peptidase, M23/M37 family [Candidatus Giovannonibacteria bacterium GW2011_GWA2_53_7]
MTNYRRHTAVLIILVVLASPPIAIAQSPTEIQQQINNHNSEIKKLDEEIAEYQKQLSATSAKKNTLQAKLDELNLSIKKKNAEISQTQNKIDTTKLEIKQLAGNIETARQSINVHSMGLGESIRALSIAEDQPIAAQVLSEGTQDVWNDIVVSQRVQSAVRTHIKNLAAAKQEYTDTKTATEAKQAQLVKQQQTLKTQQGSLSAQKTAQNDLLKQTQSQEANYQKIIAQKKMQQAAFEDALNNLQTQLQYTVNPSTITVAGKGILRYPVDNVIITQYFGNTPFASSGAYGGKGHNGIDLGASIGTPLRAAASGVVLATGNTDATRGCYSFGKWVFIKHPNGLGTMYAHLSQISVSSGQQVATGQLIGYSGETGYATGPHLHFGVYVASATQIMRLGDATKKTTPCSGVMMPVAPVSGYLNPLNYL